MWHFLAKKVESQWKADDVSSKDVNICGWQTKAHQSDFDMPQNDKTRLKSLLIQENDGYVCSGQI